MVSFILFLNRFFRVPNVEGRESDTAYSEWEHRMGRELVRIYMEPAGDVRDTGENHPGGRFPEHG